MPNNGREKPITTVFPTPGHVLILRELLNGALLKALYESPTFTEVECKIAWLSTIDSR